MDLVDILNNDGADDQVDEATLQAAMVVQKLAADNGVDLETDVSPEEYAELINDARGKVASAPEEEQNMEIDQRAVLTEITKRAAAEDMDLTDLTDEEFAQVYNKVAEQLTDPAYHEELNAHVQKVASHEEAYSIGQTMSAGFLEGLNADEDKVAGTPIGKPGAAARRAYDAVKGAPSKADELLQRLGTKSMNAAGAGAEGASPALKRSAGAAAGGAVGAVAAGAGYGAKKLHDKMKKDYPLDGDKALLSTGGDKQSADEVLSEAIHERALELIAEEQAKAAAFEGITETQFEDAALEHAMALLEE